MTYYIIFTDISSVSKLYFYFFFFKQKTAYEMRISDWSSDVCSSDLGLVPGVRDRRARLLSDLVAGRDRAQQARGHEPGNHPGTPRHPVVADRILGTLEPCPARTLERRGAGVVGADIGAIRVERGATRVARFPRSRRCRSAEHTSEIQSLIRYSYP